MPTTTDSPSITRVFNPNLSIVKADYLGNKYNPSKNRFYNTKERKQPSFSDMMRALPSRREVSRRKKENPFQVPMQPNKTFTQGTEDVIVWLGHASFFIRINGVNIITDPCLGRVSGVMKRLVDIPCQITDITDIDYILMSHGHRDHFDVPSLNALLPHNRKAQFLIPLKLHSLFKQLKIKPDWQEAGWWQEYDIDHDIRIVFTPAIHWNRRGLFDFNDMLWGGFWIESKGKSIFFSGDTAYGDHFKAVKQTLGSPSISILPIGAYEPKYIMKSSHTNPWEAVDAFNDLESRTFIPMHYGTYDLSDEPLGAPIHITRNLFKHEHQAGELVDLAVGQAYQWG